VRRRYENPPIIEQGQRLAGLAATLAQVRALGRRPARGNGDEALAPDRATTLHASAWAREMYRDARGTGLGWRSPHVTASAEGEVVFEWWNAGKKLTVYLSSDTATSIQVWGPDVTTEMDEGDASTSTRRRQLWTWLMG
jgi:hypothetical protein